METVVELVHEKDGTIAYMYVPAIPRVKETILYKDVAYVVKDVIWNLPIKQGTFIKLILEEKCL
jgi:hypothetical protein